MAGASQLCRPARYSAGLVCRLAVTRSTPVGRFAGRSGTKWIGDCPHRRPRAFALCGNARQFLQLL